jgi:3-oxoacyl-(acyl-carrier-protein) synthase
MSNILNRRRVVITGLSVLSPLGNTIAELSKQVFGGISGIKLIDVVKLPLRQILTLPTTLLNTHTAC